MRPSFRVLPLLRPAVDLAVTLLVWGYYLLGYFLLFSPLHLASWLFARDREGAFQKLNHLFFRSFFWLLRAIVPGLAIVVPDRIRTFRGAVIVSNHLSFLDPLLLISLFPRQKTIVRSDFFGTPVFGRLLRLSGYLPSSSENGLGEIVLKQVGGMREFLASGGNLFVFPEGTRSRTGRLGPFNRGAFRIARLCEAPIAVLCIRNTDRLYPPDRFLFRTCHPNKIEVVWLGTISPAYWEASFALSRLMADVRALYEEKGCGAAGTETTVRT